jgi:hypothetical protein
MDKWSLCLNLEHEPIAVTKWLRNVLCSRNIMEGVWLECRWKDSIPSCKGVNSTSVLKVSTCSFLHRPSKISLSVGILSYLQVAALWKNSLVCSVGADLQCSDSVCIVILKVEYSNISDDVKTYFTNGCWCTVRGILRRVYCWLQRLLWPLLGNRLTTGHSSQLPSCYCRLC